MPAPDLANATTQNVQNAPSNFAEYAYHGKVCNHLYYNFKCLTRLYLPINITVLGNSKVS